MKIKFYLFIIGIILSFPINLFAQTTPYRSYNSNLISWNKLAFSGKLYKKLGYTLDFEYRRQADPDHAVDPNAKVGASKSNLFKNPFQYVIRGWFNYQVDKNFTLGYSPFAWFGTWNYPVDEKQSFRPEYRMSFQASLNQSLGKIQLTHRFRYEIRRLGLKTIDSTNNFTGNQNAYHFWDSNKQYRLRYMLRAVMPFKKEKVEAKTAYMYSHTEIFVNTGENVKNINLLDQFRSSLGFGYKISNALRIELGYMNIIAYKFNNKAQNNVDVNHCIVLNVLFDDFNALFKKKE